MSKINVLTIVLFDWFKKSAKSRIPLKANLSIIKNEMKQNYKVVLLYFDLTETNNGFELADRVSAALEQRTVARRWHLVDVAHTLNAKAQVERVQVDQAGYGLGACSIDKHQPVFGHVQNALLVPWVFS